MLHLFSSAIRSARHSTIKVHNLRLFTNLPLPPHLHKRARIVDDCVSLSVVYHCHAPFHSLTAVSLTRQLESLLASSVFTVGLVQRSRVVDCSFKRTERAWEQRYCTRKYNTARLISQGRLLTMSTRLPRLTTLIRKEISHYNQASLAENFNLYST